MDQRVRRAPLKKYEFFLPYSKVVLKSARARDPANKITGAQQIMKRGFRVLTGLAQASLYSSLSSARLDWARTALALRICGHPALHSQGAGCALRQLVVSTKLQSGLTLAQRCKAHHVICLNELPWVGSDCCNELAWVWQRWLR